MRDKGQIYHSHPFICNLTAWKWQKHEREVLWNNHWNQLDLYSLETLKGVAGLPLATMMPHSSNSVLPYNLQIWLQSHY